MAAEQRSGLEAVDPRVGQTLRADGMVWEVTDHSSYWNDAGFRVTEWCCETEDTEAYLLKEVKEGEAVRWFFTRKISAETVTVAAGEPLPKWFEKNKSATPPGTLTREGRAYTYAETDAGTYEDEPGQRVGKTTWEYWDEPHARNLAVEIWEDGRLDCYHGAYVDPGQVTIVGTQASSGGSDAAAGAAALPFVAGLKAAGERAVAAARSAEGPKAKGKAVPSRANPFLTAVVVLPLAYLIPFFMGRPLDEGLAVALPLAALAGWLRALVAAPAVGGLALVGTPVLAYLFWRFPPLTNGWGLAALLVAPGVIAWFGRRHVGRGRLPVAYAAGFVVAGPALVLGLYHYFKFAPLPHTLGQLGLALAPSVFGGVAGALIAGLILATTEDAR
jgi:hypothetical protein